ncbi:MAG TPA: demethoxyubiquinone hydroxylase family protein [Chloroflexota bacterium]|nr:demethoxyubiquinone hydroxylase family protein [Chloroflexota bacterium]
MPQTDPFTYNAPKKMSDAELARALRLDAAAEIDAMNLYEAHIEATDNEDAKKVLAFIAKDEKEHFALFVELIRRLDPAEADELTQSAPKLDVILRTPIGGIAEQAVESAGGPAATDVTRQRDLLRRTTVGSLLEETQG